MIKYWLIRTWRRITGRCGLCGKPKAARNPKDIYTLGLWCHKCNKTLTFASLYGGNSRYFQRTLFQ